MSLNTTDNSVQAIFIEPTVLIDEVSSTEYYIGTSKSFNSQSAANWRINIIWQEDTVWMSGYPNGDQSFNFVWNDRASAYVYS